MKNTSVITIFVLLLSSFLIYDNSIAQRPILISTDEIPSTIGTTWTTINDTTESVIVDVGSAGANQSWNFTESIEGIEIRQTIVPLESTPFDTNFPESNFVMKYEGGLLDLIYSDVFPQIKGDVYFFQEITDSAVFLVGTGFKSSFITGSAHFMPPNAILNFIPTQYKDEWATKSIFTITKDTTILGVSGEFKLTVNDSAYSIIDAWGTITLPMGEFECLRMKSYVTMNEEVTFNDTPVATKKARVINYNWLAEDYGIVMRVTSHTAEDDDNFNDARLYSRMQTFISGTSEVAQQNSESPENFRLHQNYPNPFNPSTSITYELDTAGLVSLKVFNLLGNEIATLVEEQKEAGHFTASWDGRDARGQNVSSGVYLYKIQAGNKVDSHKMLLLR